MFGMGFQEFAIVAIVAILLFGKRLPEVARSFGQSYKQFRDGLHDIQRQMDTNDYSSQRQMTYSDPDEPVATSFEQPTAPKFELPPADPAPDEPQDKEQGQNEQNQGKDQLQNES